MLFKLNTDTEVFENYIEEVERAGGGFGAGILKFSDEIMQFHVIWFTLKYYIGKIHAELTS